MLRRQRDNGDLLYTKLYCTDASSARRSWAERERSPVITIEGYFLTTARAGLWWWYGLMMQFRRSSRKKITYAKDDGRPALYSAARAGNSSPLPAPLIIEIYPTEEEREEEEGPQNAARRRRSLTFFYLSDFWWFDANANIFIIGVKLWKIYFLNGNLSFVHARVAKANRIFYPRFSTAGMHRV